MTERYVPEARRKIELDDGVKGFIFKCAKRNFWRVSSWYELDDLIQDGYLCYAKCYSRFVFRATMENPPPNEERRQFMRFLQMSFMNHISDLANDRVPETALARLPEEQADAIESWTAHAGEMGDANVRAMLASAPQEILDLLKAILVEGKADGPYRKTKLRKKFLPGCSVPRIVKGRRAVRETTEQFYDRCLGTTGVVQKLRAYFLGHDDPLEQDSMS